MRHAAGRADGCAITTSRACDWRRKLARAYKVYSVCTAAGNRLLRFAHGGTCVIDVRDVWFQLPSVSGEAACKRPNMPLPILAAIQWGARLRASAIRVCAAIHVARQRGDGRIAVLHKRTGTATGDTAACS